MNRINKWLALLMGVMALGGVAISAQAIEADVNVAGDPDKYSYVSTAMKSFDGETLETDAGTFLIDSSVKVTDDRILDEDGTLPDEARVQLTLEDGVLRAIAIY